MGMVVPQQRIASAFVVCFGPFGAVSQHARQRGVCRQRVYREAAWVEARVDGSAWPQAIDRLRQENRTLQRRVVELQQRLEQAVVLDHDKQAEFACLGQAMGVGLAQLERLLDVLLPCQAPSVATLGRWTKAAGEKSAALLAVLDEYTRPLVKQALADEIYVKRPTLMVVEPESLCWLSGRLTERVDGASWAAELGLLANLEQVSRDAGSGLSKGVAELNRQRAQAGKSPVADQLDHFHTLLEGARAVGRAERAAKRALAAIDKIEADIAERRRQGQPMTGCSNRLRVCWPKANQALEAWEKRDRAWQTIQGALLPFTPEGELNTRTRAEAVLAKAVAELPDKEFATTKRLVQQPQTLTYLDEIQRKLHALPVAVELRQAAVRQEGLRRRPELLRGESVQAAALRGVLLVCGLLLSKAGEAGAQAVHGVRSVLRSSWRASSLVECINSAVRMQQARHRKMSQGLLDLKRLYWNYHAFRTGRRRGTSPYQRVGLPWPEGLRWWDVLKWSPEQLREKLSTLAKTA
jgi:hypothetical protein